MNKQYLREHWEEIILPVKQGKTSLKELSSLLFPQNSKSYILDSLKNIEKFKLWWESDERKELTKKIKQEKIKQTCFERYGVKTISQAQEIKEKIRKATLASNNNEFTKEKSKKTCLERYGTEIFFNSNYFKEKSKKTCLERYGVENPIKLKETIQKSKNTCLKKYGATNYNKSRLSKERIEKNTIEKWKQLLQTNDLSNWREILGEDFINFKKTITAIWLEKIHKNPGNICYKFWGNDTSFINHLNNPRYQELIFQSHYTSNLEKKIMNILKSYGIESRKEIIEKNEIDIFVPSLNIGFEINGYPFHTSTFQPDFITSIPKDTNYHRNKTDFFLNKGIKLYHFWRMHDEKDDIIISSILSKLKIFKEKHFARNLILKEISTKEALLFFENNHLLGKPSQNITKNIALCNNNDIIMCMSFTKQNDYYNNVRNATKKYNTVVGGFQRIISKISYPIITFCDRDLTPDYKDSVYFRNNFTFINDTGNSLRYYNQKKNCIESREKYMKFKLKKLFPNSYSENKTEQEILSENNIYPCYNSGNFKFIKNY
jgi:hypothetical protein